MKGCVLFVNWKQTYCQRHRMYQNVIILYTIERFKALDTCHLLGFNVSVKGGEGERTLPRGEENSKYHLVLLHFSLLTDHFDARFFSFFYGGILLKLRLKITKSGNPSASTHHPTYACWLSCQHEPKKKKPQRESHFAHAEVLTCSAYIFPVPVSRSQLPAIQNIVY